MEMQETDFAQIVLRITKVNKTNHQYSVVGFFMQESGDEMFGIFKNKKSNLIDREITQEEIREKFPVRKIINGKLYDTSKAERVYLSVRYNIVVGRYIRSEYYVTDKGNYFSVVDGNIFLESEEGIKEALSTCPDICQKYFGKVEEA